MTTRHLRKKQKLRSKPTDQEKLTSLEHNKPLKSKKAKVEREAIYLRIFGGIMLAGILYSWYGRSPSPPMSNWMIIGGIIVAAIFKMLYRFGIVSENNVRNLLGYLIIGVIVLLIINRMAFGLAAMFSFSLLAALFLLGVIKSFPDSKPQSPIDSQGG